MAKARLSADAIEVLQRLRAGFSPDIADFMRFGLGR